MSFNNLTILAEPQFQKILLIVGSNLVSKYNIKPFSPPTGFKKKLVNIVVNKVETLPVVF